MKLLKRLFGITELVIAKTNENSKLCKKCNRVRFLTNFSKHCQKPDGVQAWCKACCKRAIKNSKKKHINQLTKVVPVVSSERALLPQRKPIDQNTISITIQFVDIIKYEKLVRLAEKHKTTRNVLYQKMVDEFLTLNA